MSTPTRTKTAILAIDQGSHASRALLYSPTGDVLSVHRCKIGTIRRGLHHVEHDPEEIIGSVEQGIYAPNFGGGQVDITSGKFVFSASEAYLIENGRKTRPVKGAMIIGDGPDILGKISMVGNDLELDRGVGVCGKEGQSVPVGVGQPTLKIDEITVGGSA